MSGSAARRRFFKNGGGVVKIVGGGCNFYRFELWHEARNVCEFIFKEENG